MMTTPSIRNIWLPRALLVAGLILSAACEKGGIYPLLDRADKLVACGSATTTWVASTPLGTEIYTIGSLTPSAALPPGERGCFAHGFVARDSSTQYQSGTYTLDASGNGDFSFEQSYVFNYQPAIPILSREGSTETTHAPAVVEAIQIMSTPSGLDVMRNGVTSHLTNLYTLIDSIDASTQQGGEDLFRVLNLPLFTSQARLIGFGGGSMTRYIAARVFFKGALAVMAPARNEFSVKVQSLLTPNTDIQFFTFEDFSGIVVDGLQETDVNISGNGSMHGILTWSMRIGPNASDVGYTGTLDYGNMQIGDGHASGGTFGFTITSPVSLTYDVDFSLANDVDLTASLPIVP